MLRLYTERTAKTTAAILASELPELGCNITHAIGFWKGQRERSTIVETTDDNAQAISNLAARICETCGQDAVMVAKVISEVDFVGV